MGSEYFMLLVNIVYANNIAIMKKTLLFSVLLLQLTFVFGQGGLQLFDHDNVEFTNGQNYVVDVDFADWETVSPLKSE